MRNYCLALIPLAMACSDSDVPEDSYEIIEAEPFCVDYSEAGDVTMDDGVNTDSTSGRVFGQLVTGVVVDPHDPVFVSFVDYIVENVDMGGLPTVGRTDGEGHFTESLGPGHWHFKTSGHQGAYYCAADQDFTINAGQLTRVCVDMNCE